MMANNQNTLETFDTMAPQLSEASEALKAMANETRLKILCILKDGEYSVNQIVELSGQSQSAVSQHLAKLRSAGLVKSRRDAQTIYYSSEPGVGQAVINSLCGFYR